METTNINDISSVTDLFFWGEYKWPGFHSWFIGDPAFSEEDEKALQENIKRDGKNFQSFIKKFLEIGAEAELSTEEVNMLMMGVSKISSLGEDA